MPSLDLTPDQLLTTTRSVRKRLDLTRPVEPELIRECLELATQAPTGGNRQNWHFMVVTDAAKRQALGDLYRRGAEIYLKLPMNQPEAFAKLREQDPERAEVQLRVSRSSRYLIEHIHEVPVLVIPCIFGRTEGTHIFEQAGVWGSILPAAWSFMLAARVRGLASAWTTFHLFFEKEAADVLGIPYDKVMQTALLPVAHAIGTDFSPAPRVPLETITHWDQW
ncbi:MAG TPA: nitroreductase family protein [Ktedonobacterales bacterium]|nr:nitroreductase family protein [Ktedonobacterales bacterium]